jgi:hypothetical protein
VAAQDWGFMLKERLSRASSTLRDLINADLLVPGCYSKMFCQWGERNVRDAVLRRGVKSYVLG